MFPFKKLTFEDKNDIEQFTSRFEPYSDFNFTSLWTYNTRNDTEFYLDDDSFIIKFPDYISDKPVYSLLTSTNAANLIHVLFDQMKTDGQEPILHLVPEITCNEIKTNTDFLIEADRDNFDYIMSIPEVSTLEFSIYKFKRRHIRQFLSHHPNHEIRISDCKLQSEKEAVQNLFNEWASQKIDRDTSHERVALSRLLEATDKLELICVQILDQEKLVGFAFVEALKNYSIGSFMKGDGKYEYVYDMLYYQCAVALNKIGCQFLNYEQDLGILPMRDAKLHWHPTSFLRKYTIKLLK